MSLRLVLTLACLLGGSAHGAQRDAFVYLFGEAAVDGPGGWCDSLSSLNNCLCAGEFWEWTNPYCCNPEPVTDVSWTEWGCPGTAQAECGLSNLLGYATDLRSGTRGRGQFVMEFDRFDVL